MHPTAPRPRPPAKQRATRLRPTPHRRHWSPMRLTRSRKRTGMPMRPARSHPPRTRTVGSKCSGTLPKQKTVSMPPPWPLAPVSVTPPPLLMPPTKAPRRQPPPTHRAVNPLGQLPTRGNPVSVAVAAAADEAMGSVDVGVASSEAAVVVVEEVADAAAPTVPLVQPLPPPHPNKRAAFFFFFFFFFFCG